MKKNIYIKITLELCRYFVHDPTYVVWYKTKLQNKIITKNLIKIKIEKTKIEAI